MSKLLTKCTKTELIKIIFRKDDIEKTLKAENKSLKEDLIYAQKSRTHYINKLDKAEKTNRYYKMILVFSIGLNIITIIKMFLPNISS